MHYARIIEAFYSQPWAILPSKLLAIRDFLHLKAAGGDVPESRVQEIEAARRTDGVSIQGKVAILPIMGTLVQRAGMLERMSGAVGAEEIGATLDGLVNDKAVRSILLLIDSGGGSVFGIPELASKIFRARSEKKIVALADSTAASAAFWLAAQANEFYVSPGGMTGSVGVILAHQDLSRMEETLGIRTTLITSSEFKGEGHPSFPLGEETKAHLQAMTNKYHAMFVKDLARGRGVTENHVEKQFGNGRVKVDKDAVSAGMADGVATLEQLLKRLGAGSAGGVGAEVESGVLPTADDATVEPEAAAEPEPVAADVPTTGDASERVAMVRARALEVSGD